MKLKLLLCMWTAFAVSVCEGQNLIPNPSFESGSCVVDYNSTPQKIPTTIDNWYSCTGASPDPFDICGTAKPAAYAIVAPEIINGYQYARTGNKFMGLGFYPGWYEYIGTKLSVPLEAGETYKVSMWIACADMMLWASKTMGVYFSNTEISYPTTSTYGGMLNYTPQVEATRADGNFATDTTWQQVSGEFVAAGGEQWIVIGYFKSIIAGDFYLFPDPADGRKRKANPDYKPTVQGTGTTGGPRIYYYIDDVSVQKSVALPVKLSAFSGKLIQQHVQLQWATATETNNCRFEVERSADGKDFSKIGTIQGAISSNTAKQYNFTDASPLAGNIYYRLNQVDCDGKNTYSRIITIQNNAGGFSIYPNPVINTITVNRSKAGSARANVYDITGRTIISQQLVTEKETIHAEHLLPGTYIISIEGSNGTFTQKFIKK